MPLLILITYLTRKYVVFFGLQLYSLVHIADATYSQATVPCYILANAYCLLALFTGRSLRFQTLSFGVIAIGGYYSQQLGQPGLMLVASAISYFLASNLGLYPITQIRAYLRAKANDPRNIIKSLSNLSTQEFSKLSDAERGKAFECFVARLFQSINGSGKTVEQMRVQGKLPKRTSSGDSGVDVISDAVINGTKTRFLIQTKLYSGKVGNKAIQEILSAATIPYYRGNAEQVICAVITNSQFTWSDSVKDLVDANKKTLFLIEGHELVKMAKNHQMLAA